jgi:ATP-dependent HslUV protease ATP-binding subunit HslU
MRRTLEALTPKEIVQELDKYIIGQEDAKKSVAIALRNRIRRRKLPQELQDEIAPKNIIMIGPTGVGKTEIARRLSKLTGAPFIKVEATKYTEVGYVGRDVESMVRDLMSLAISMVKNEMQQDVKEEAETRTEEALLDLLLPGPAKKDKGPQGPGGIPLANIFGGSLPKPQIAEPPIKEEEKPDPTSEKSDTREKLREMLKEGKLEDKQVEVSISGNSMPAIEVFSGNSFEEMDFNLSNISNLFGGKKKKKLVSIKRAREILLAEEMDKLIDSDRVSEIARQRTEEMGIIFIDEIDKIASKESRSGVDVSREGVQRDILPIVEGSKVNTKHGIIDTSHILFIAAGAFHMSKPSDLIPELQGRFPLRVELNALDGSDFLKILTQPRNALIKQYTELLKTEDVTLDFKDEAIARLAEIAAEVNTKTENIGARRLHTIMELLLEDVSFNASEIMGQTVTITAAYVNDRLNDVVEDQDLSRYIL